MMRARNRVLLSFLAALLGTLGIAQAGAPADPPPPPGKPYLAYLPAKARFSMTGESKDGQPSGGGVPYVKDYQMIKDGLVKHGVVDYSDGKVSDLWIYKDNFVCLTGSSSTLFMEPARNEGGPDLFPFGADDFSGLGWVNEATYRGISAVDGEKCYVFDSEAFPSRHVWISITTRWPVMLQQDNAVYRFHYMDPISLALPNALSEALKANDRELQKLTATRKAE